MDATNTLDLLEQLDDEIDDLEEALRSVTKTALQQTASKLPVLDKAKLYVLSAYAVESMLFSYLRLHGVNAREHPVFRELARVKQYFDKIKAAENPVGKRENLQLDKAAAARFIKAGLSGNDKLEMEQAEKAAKERALQEIRARGAKQKTSVSTPQGADASSSGADKPGASTPAKHQKKRKHPHDSQGKSGKQKQKKKKASKD